MYLVTGGAGFIGSNVVAALADRGERVVVCDWFGSGEKWRNVAKHDVCEFVFPEDLPVWLNQYGEELAAIVHMGAISATTETNVDLIVRSNLQLTDTLWRWSANHGKRLVYASSAATYGDGAAGFEDRSDMAYLASLRPLNAYGWSKLAFDRRAMKVIERGEPAPPKWAGLKFFNVYGPNEYHKGSMQSVIAHNCAKLARGEPLRLFKSYHQDYADGGQMRDFVYVKDCVGVIVRMLDGDFASGLYNVGSGTARSWIDLGRAMFAALGVPEKIEFIDMPEQLRGKYQYFTQAPMNKLRAAGYRTPFATLEEGVADYVKAYLTQPDIYR